MKSTILLALAFVLFYEAQSQKTIIRFEGLNDAKEKYYTVDIEGRKFHSATAKQTATSGVRVFEINYLASGNHDLIVYAVNNNSVEYNSQVQPIYNNSFQLKADRETIIIVGKNGEVAFSEKPLHNTSHATHQLKGVKQPISMEQFNGLYAAMKNQYTATDRYTILNNALEVPTNYFTIFQLNTLLSLINPESDRLALAKKSSTHLLPEANASSLLEVFSSQENRNALSAHLGIRN
jgi:Domain of unknown function (DUF4476)